ncbi:hypothetical protein J2S17_002817 [Cytobacillus purgationiresistens]|uniref:Spo0E like sporulation regulatory protein n=1 Tax=Cytobacillus purgationiresistens TaxID=863449 RepID=A0ABU0AI47_9BACI|nr:hypothetical protein [Cytobacillus purgationiresistens]
MIKSKKISEQDFKELMEEIHVCVNKTQAISTIEVISEIKMKLNSLINKK